MKFNSFQSLLLFCALSSAQAFACDIHGRTGLMPEVDHRIPVGDKMASDMTEEKFNALIDKVNVIYKPIIEKVAGVPFIVNRRWKDDVINAYAAQFQTSWRVTMYGGLARHPLITDDALMSVLCHEIGHHIGGAPIAVLRNGKEYWASNEGQADYFAALKCLKRVMENDDNVAIVSKMQVDSEVTGECQSVYQSTSEIALCQRIAMAAKAEAMMMASYTENPKISFSTPDKSVVKETNHDHPETQCRLDTAFQAVLCNKSVLEDFVRTSPIPGSCTVNQGYSKGMRPLCWYKPSAAEL